MPGLPTHAHALLATDTDWPGKKVGVQNFAVVCRYSSTLLVATVAARCGLLTGSAPPPPATEDPTWLSTSLPCSTSERRQFREWNAGSVPDPRPFAPCSRGFGPTTPPWNKRLDKALEWGRRTLNRKEQLRHAGIARFPCDSTAFLLYCV